MFNKRRILGLALTLFVVLLMGCNKVTGGGTFVSDDIFLGATLGDKCTFAFSAQQVGTSGAAKGKVQLIDHTLKINVHADLNLTADGGDPNVAGYVGDGTATVKVDGINIPGSFSVVAFAIDNPDYVVLLLLLDGNFVASWSGAVSGGNITVH